MSKYEKLKRCNGCRNDFYNDKNPLGVKECWSLESMKLVRMKMVHMSDVPPWNHPVKWYPSCYSPDRYVMINPKVQR